MITSMPISKEYEPAILIVKHPTPQRPKTLLQRLSSGLIHALPSFRTPTSKPDPVIRPKTVPNVSWKYLRRIPIVVSSEQLFISQAEIAVAGYSGKSCPYDPHTYNSFTSIEKRRCSFCGMRGPKKTQGELCQACRSGGAGSHIRSGREFVNAHRRHSATDARHPVNLADSTPSVNLEPRPVTPQRAAKRIGNTSRVSRLPPGIICLPAANALHTAPNRTATKSNPSGLGKTYPGGQQYNVQMPRSGSSSSRGEQKKKPSNPKLHHVHGLPNSENFSFVHRHEISKHAVALRAGSTSPSTDRSKSPRSVSGIGGTYDYSNTVYYGDRTSPFSNSNDGAPKPHVTTVLVKRVQASGSVAVDLQALPLEVALNSSETCRTCLLERIQLAKSPQTIVDVIDSGTTFGSQDTGSTEIGDVRVELRGGSGHEEFTANTFKFRLKKWLLTCHIPCPDNLDTDSDGNPPPARVVSPHKVEKMRQKMNGRAYIPSYMLRLVPSNSPEISCAQDTESFSPPTTFVTIISGPPKRHLSLRLPSFPSLNLPKFFHHQPKSPPDLSVCAVSPDVLTPPLPHLRGGAGSPDNVPPTLFWLAGGTGKPISFSDWKLSRPKQRVGGLFGMAVFGEKYGKDYKDNTSGADELVVSCSTSINIMTNDAASTKPKESSGSTSSSSSSSAVQSTGDVPASADSGEPAQPTPTPSPTVLAGDLPVCSGALPVEPAADVTKDDDPQSLLDKDAEAEAVDAAPEIENKADA